MDAEVKSELEKWAKSMAAELIEKSPELERFLPQDSNSWLNQLERLGSLSELTKNSMPAIPANAPSVEVIPAQKAKEYPTPSQQNVVFDSENKQYKPALKNQGLIDALIQYHRQKLGGALPKSKQTPSKAAPQKSPQTQAQENEKNSKPKFNAFRPLEVEGEPKSLSPIRSTRPGQRTIYKSRLPS